MAPIMQEVMQFEEVVDGEKIEGSVLQIEPVSVKDHETLMGVRKLCAKLEKVVSVKGLKFLPKL